VNLTSYTGMLKFCERKFDALPGRGDGSARRDYTTSSGVAAVGQKRNGSRSVAFSTDCVI